LSNHTSCIARREGICIHRNGHQSRSERFNEDELCKYQTSRFARSRTGIVSPES